MKVFRRQHYGYSHFPLIINILIHIMHPCKCLAREVLVEIFDSMIFQPEGRSGQVSMKYFENLTCFAILFYKGTSSQKPLSISMHFSPQAKAFIHPISI